MRFKKIRGHKRRWKQIEKWATEMSSLNTSQLSRINYDYTKVWIHPWSGISITNSSIPEPYGETRKRILQGLIRIYDSWKLQLEQRSEPYYLKIWLFEQRPSKSQVVCAIGDRIHVYENTFHNAKDDKVLNLKHFGTLQNQLAKFHWDHRLDEEHLMGLEDEVGSIEDYRNPKDFFEMKSWYVQRMKSPHRTVSVETYEGVHKEVHSFKIGDVWIGELKRN